MTTDEQYVPSEDEMRHAYWLTRLLDHHAAVDAAFDRFLARVRRDAAREALNGLARNLAATSGDTEAEEVRDYRDAHYPEERPVTEQQIDLRERELDYWMTRAYEAEGKLWKAEKRLAGWMEHWNATARTGAVDEVAAILEANARADQAEARIKAVRDVLDRWQVDGYDALLRRIRSALDGDA